MQYPWLFIILFLLFVGVICWSLFRFRFEKPKPAKGIALLAHTETVTALPEYKKAQKQYHRLLCAAAALFVVAGCSITTLAARPVNVSEESENYETRDLMICMDVSGSMYELDAEFFLYLKDVVKELKGQRIGITLFDSAPVLFMPLSNDYEAVSNMIQDMHDDFVGYTEGYTSSYGYEHHDSAYMDVVYSVGGGGSSQIATSMVGCVNNFDKLQSEERSRAVIVVTDTYNGTETITYSQAAEYARRYGVVIYGVNGFTGDYGSRISTIEMLKENIAAGNTSLTEVRFFQAVSTTGGSYFLKCVPTKRNTCSSNDVEVKEIVDQIMSLEAIRTKGAPKIVRTDAPMIPAIVSLVSCCLLLLIIWRLKL